MKVNNATKWNTKDLIKLTRAVSKFSGRPLPRHLEFRSNRGNRIFWKGKAQRSCCRGRAIVNGSWVKMLLPKITSRAMTSHDNGNEHTFQDVPTEFPTTDFAQVLIHELDHNLGLEHSEMCYARSIVIPDEIKRMQVTPKTVKPKPKRDIVQERYLKAQKQVKLYGSKVKRYETLLKKWGKKVKYYEKRGCD